MDIPNISGDLVVSWILEGLIYLRLIKKCIKAKTILARDEDINKRLVARAEDMISNQSRMHQLDTKHYSQLGITNSSKWTINGDKSINRCNTFRITCMII